MGLIIKISAYGEWERTYFVQDLNKENAKEKVFKMFKQLVSCYLADTLEEFENDNGCYIEIITEVEQIIL